jgi:histidine triad (HIT) family protein
MIQQDNRLATRAKYASISSVTKSTRQCHLRQLGKLMAKNDCIFCKIVAGEIPCTKIYDDSQAFAFRDVDPKAPIHILVIPREHIESLNDATQADEMLLGHLLRLVPEIAHQQGISESGFRTVINTGSGSGQQVFHLHLHILGGRPMTWPPG